MPNLEGEGLERVKTCWLWNGTLLMLYDHSYLSLQPLGSHSLSVEDHLLNGAVRALCYHVCHVTVFWRRTQVSLKPKQTPSVNELQKNPSILQNLEDWLAALSYLEYIRHRNGLREECFYIQHTQAPTIT